MQPQESKFADSLLEVCKWLYFKFPNINNSEWSKFHLKKENIERENKNMSNMSVLLTKNSSINTSQYKKHHRHKITHNYIITSKDLQILKTLSKHLRCLAPWYAALLTPLHIWWKSTSTKLQISFIFTCDEAKLAFDHLDASPSSNSIRRITLHH